MKRPLFLLLAILILLAGSPSAGAFPLDYVEGDVIVGLNPGVTIGDINAAYGTTTLATLSFDTNVYRLGVPAGQTTASILADMAPDVGAPPARLSFAEPNSIGSAPEAGSNDHWNWGGGNAAPYDTQYATENLNLDWVHSHYTEGAGIVVAFLDTGVAFNHPTLSGHFVDPARRWDFVDNDNDPSEVLGGVASGHGTHVAGIIHRAAPQAVLLPVRVLDANGDSNAWLVADAIKWTADEMWAHGERGVMNLSLGTTVESNVLREAVRYASDTRNILVAAAVGNQNLPQVLWPAADSRALAVTALDPQDRKAGFANYGPAGNPAVDIAAYGVSIYSTMIYTDGTPGFAWWSGTSMATPFVSGVAALYRAYNPADDAHTALRNLRDAAYAVDHLNPAYAGLLGHGLLDPEAALLGLDGCYWADVFPAVPNQCDFQVSVGDVQAVAAGWGAQRGATGYNRRLDIDRNDRIDIVDVQLIAGQFGWSGTPGR